jgi:two-component system phosphate regulon sensor histidine kinase PhoR
MIVSQLYWLFNQYQLSLRNLENDTFAKTVNLAEWDMALRDSLGGSNLYAVTRSEMKVEQNTPASKVVWGFETYIVNDPEVSLELPAVPYDSLKIDSLYKEGKDIRKYTFRVEIPNQKYDAFDALNRFYIHAKCPFTTERMDSLLRANELKPATIRIETTDSMIWDAGRFDHASIWYPSMEVIYPFNVLQQQQFRVTYSFSVFNILEKMLVSFFFSLALSFLLIFCMIYQIKTIFMQQRMDEMRKNFMFTMIHELKRPITALKLCVSFIKNDKMMVDREMKEEIIKNSHNELDNLSSYFSKLRDVMADDIKTVPLNLSAFNLKELVEQCVKKQFLPNDRAIDIKTVFENNAYEITADKMHIGKIIYNLLENAVKYSDGQVSILVDCRSMGEKFIIEVSDNGYGISKTESNYVFNRFFRGKDVIQKDIPGMGLGLFYVKLLVRTHRGTIILRSELGKGSRFTIELPKRQ